MDLFSWNSRNGETGLSVLEVAAVVMTAGIITAMSVVMFSNGKARYQLSRKAENFRWQIERARSIAIKHNQTLTLGFAPDGSFGLTCADCDAAKGEIKSLPVPGDISLSSRPTLTISGNGTITGGSSIDLKDDRGRQVTITIKDSGRVSVGDVTQTTATAVH